MEVFMCTARLAEGPFFELRLPASVPTANAGGQLQQRAV
jgi:hypothetical protein